MFDASFIVFLCFITFMFFVFKYGYQRSISALDKQIGEIKNTINSAEENHHLAKAHLSQEKKSQKLLSKEIEELFQKTDQQIDMMKTESVTDLKKLVTAKETLMDSMIDQIRLKTITDLKEIITQEIQMVLTDLMTNRLDPQTHEALNEDAIHRLREMIGNGNNNPSHTSIKATQKVANL